MSKTNINIRLSPEDKEVIEDYAKLNNQTVTTFIREAVFEYMEDQYDYNLAEERALERKKNSVTYTLEEAKAEIFGEHE